eukprot:TRINITY_DN11672_c0_g1_i1.p1 TRINITY_DN11672_c0_g1~~TRINITY_DN11672_c0_g1_i1.p1  ORF type:complete len:370 (-),score=41.85 TRINITY_DN11672_c0_g1_i1:90-1199(-)
MLPARLVIVVASWTSSVVSHVEASSAKDGSFAELRQRFIDKLKEDSAGPAGHSLRSLQAMASALLQTDSDPYGLSLQTPTMYQLVNLTRELDEQLSAQLLFQHQVAQAAINNFSGWAECNRTRDQCLGGVPATTGAPTTTAVPTTTSTTATGCACCQLANCSRELEWVRIQMNYTCSELARENRSVDEVKTERCNETWATTYEDYLERDIEKLATLQLLNENCTNWTQRWINTSGECADGEAQCYIELRANETLNQADQGSSYECCSGEQQNASSISYETCMLSAAATWQDEVNSQLILAESRQTEWRAVKRIMCLSDVLYMNASQDQRGALQACIDARYNASHLILGIFPKPSPLECGDLTNWLPSGW